MSVLSVPFATAGTMAGEPSIVNLRKSRPLASEFYYSLNIGVLTFPGNHKVLVDKDLGLACLAKEEGGTLARCLVAGLPDAWEKAMRQHRVDKGSVMKSEKQPAIMEVSNVRLSGKRAAYAFRRWGTDDGNVCFLTGKSGEVATDWGCTKFVPEHSRYKILTKNLLGARDL